jgi:hypothetical protein
MRRFLRDHGLTLTLLGLFVLSLLGQAGAGYALHAREQLENGETAPVFSEYLRTGHFLEAVAENWESEFLQMGVLVLLTCCLFQKGSPESNDPDQEQAKSEAAHRRNARAPWPVRRGGLVAKVYGHSLGIAFMLMFVGSFAFHVAAGQADYNAERKKGGEHPVTRAEYLTSSKFWYQSFQNWQSEFLSIACMVYLSVYLRQDGSAQSKPVWMPHSEQEA